MDEVSKEALNGNSWVSNSQFKFPNVVMGDKDETENTTGINGGKSKGTGKLRKGASSKG